MFKGFGGLVICLAQGTLACGVGAQQHLRALGVSMSLLTSAMWFRLVVVVSSPVVSDQSDVAV